MVLMPVGIGYDIHKLVKGRKLIIGGIEIPYEKGLMGHTDADVLVHAIIDSLLGAAGLGDIGTHFPDTDPKWKDASSIELLEVVYLSIKNKGYELENIDSTIIAEEPKITPHTKKMRSKLAQTLGIKDRLINIKSKTNEGLDSIGKKDAIAAFATCCLSTDT